MRRFFVLAAPLLSMALAACGDGPDEAAPVITGTAAGGTAAASTPTPRIGPNPTLGNYITAITPGNGDTVGQPDTRTRDGQRPRGTCFEAVFKDLQETGLWFRMAFDGKEVTEELVWLVSNRDNATGGRACFAPPEGFPPGRHTAAVSVQNPNNPNEPPRQIVAWAFDVVP